MIEETKFEKLFSTPLLRFKVANHAALSRALLAEGAMMQSEEDGVSKSNRLGWHSSGNLFDRNADPIVELRVAAEMAILAATRRITTKVDPETLKMKLFGWMNVNPQGGYNVPHTHPGAHWSGVYYVSQPEIDEGNSGMIEFLAPRTDLSHWAILKASAFSLKKRIRPAAGEIVVFPSYLLHWVYPNEADADRVTIAFNATFSKPKG
ncbi:TIGR02466 family protein [Alisedimentitalea sp. MJ-SS2]|uniref:TIGR02466 family protein n=1 Tax=Aliisedimentitalea sp. MJ-SS2 TaxID=3049795 RepID=UPI0029067FC4|nr:TIGR02466 family protein [Alisedimentitalea sp. MJ-SS2]MDU8928557.1 TIGR02466 family protein [Alisedimentitalea sp. MJ-SS2]